LRSRGLTEVNELADSETEHAADPQGARRPFGGTDGTRFCGAVVSIGYQAAFRRA